MPMTELHRAVEATDVARVRELISTPAGREMLNHPDETAHDKTPLHIAATSGHPEVVVALIAAGARVDVREGGDNTPLHLAAASGHEDAVLVLIRAGADVHSRDILHRTPLHDAVVNYRPALVAALIDSGADVGARDDTGRTPLHLSDNAASVTALMAAGADIHALDNRGCTPLHCAATLGHTEAVTAMILHGADVSARNKHGRTPLHNAARNGLAGAVAALVAAGADDAVLDSKGHTPRDCAKNVAAFDDGVRQGLQRRAALPLFTGDPTPSITADLCAAAAALGASISPAVSVSPPLRAMAASELAQLDAEIQGLTATLPRSKLQTSQ